MSHGIIEGKDHMMSGSGVVAWHGIGTVVKGKATAKEALTVAKLDYTVVKKKLQVAGGKAFEKLFAIVREDNGDPLGVVGSRYEPIQNSQGLDILDPVIGNDAVYETAGSLHGGKVVWFLASLNKEYFLSGKTDQMKQYFLIFLSHDGSKPVSVRFVNTRVVCANTMAIALGEARALVTIRHTKGFQDKLQEAHRLVGLADKHAQEFQKVYATLQNQKMSEKQANNFLETWLPGDGTRVSNTRGQVFELFQSGVGNEGKTRVDMLNATTEFLTHKKAVRNKNPDQARFEISMMGYGLKMQSEAVDLLLN